MPHGKDTARIVTYLTKEDKIIIEQLAKSENISLSNMISKIVSDYIKSSTAHNV